MHKTVKTRAFAARLSCWWDMSQDWQHIRANEKRKKDHISRNLYAWEYVAYSLSPFNGREKYERIVSHMCKSRRKLTEHINCKVPTVDIRHTPLIRWLLEIISRFVDHYYYYFKSKRNSIRVMVIGVPFTVNTSDKNKVFWWRRFRLLILWNFELVNNVEKGFAWLTIVLGVGILSDNWAERAPDIIFKTSNEHNQHKTYHIHDSWTWLRPHSHDSFNINTHASCVILLITSRKFCLGDRLVHATIRHC